MSNKNFPKDKKKKLPYGVTETFVEELEKSSIDQLRSQVVLIQQQTAESSAFLKGDLDNLAAERHKGAIELQDLKADYTQAAGPVRDAIRALKNKNKLLLEALAKSGG